MATISENIDIRKIIDVYDTSFSCTYIEIEGDNGDTQYRRELLKAFKLTEYVQDEIDKRIDLVYNIFCKNINSDNSDNSDNSINLLFSIVRKRNPWPIEFDAKMCIMMLFSFDYFFLFHEFLKAFLTSCSKDKINMIIKQFNELFP